MCLIDVSIVVPAFNSASFIQSTLDEIATYISTSDFQYEVIVVVDGSPDDTYQSVVDFAKKGRISQMHVIELSTNYGQHTANFCGFENARGAWVATMDDDGQNPASELQKFEKYINSDCDLVVGKLIEKKHNALRRLGSSVVLQLNRIIFNTPSDLKLSNFRLIRRDVVERIIADKSPRPYIPGLCLKYSYRPINVEIQHRPREVGSSNYSLTKLSKLVLDLLFQHSNIPLVFVVMLSGVFSFIGIFGAVWLFFSSLFFGVEVDGWTSLIVSLFFFSGLIMLTVSVIGFYLIRLLENSSYSVYDVKRRVDFEDE